MSLPKLTLTLRVNNPDWVPVYETMPDGGRVAVNWSEYYIDAPTEVEVLQLNLSAGTMRVRYRQYSHRLKKGTEIATTDMSIEPFTKLFEIVAKS